MPVRRARAPRLVTDPAESARVARPRYVPDDRLGIRRRQVRRGFVYTDADGRRVRDPEMLARMKSLVIPPALLHPPGRHRDLSGGGLADALERRVQRRRARAPDALRPAEAAVLALLQARLGHERAA